MRGLLVVALVAIVLPGVPVHADLIQWFIPSGSSVGGQPVDAEVEFTTSTDEIVVVLRNLQVDPRSVIQNVSSLFFTVSTAQNAGTMISSSGIPRLVASDGAFSDGAAVSTGWDLTTSGAQLELTVLGTAAGPAHTLLGLPDGAVYAQANGSIAGNDPHNPFLAPSATFTLRVPGVTADSTILDADFGFGTTPGNNVQGVVPEPATMALLALGALVLARRRK